MKYRLEAQSYISWKSCPIKKKRQPKKNWTYSLETGARQKDFISITWYEIQSKKQGKRISILLTDTKSNSFDGINIDS